jgi:hypothetical protein
MKENEIEINGVQYIKKELCNQTAPELNGMPFVIIRTQSAGVHFGYLKKRESTLAGIEVELIKSRRVWYWDGAASLSQMAVDGVNKPENCKFSMEVESIRLVAIEIISVTEKAQSNLTKVQIWKK